MHSDESNITHRRKNRKGTSSHSNNNSFIDTSSSFHDISDTACSLPDLSRALLNTEVEELRCKLMKVRLDLERTQNEVDNLNSENHSLQQIIQSQQTKIEQLKLLCTLSSTPNKGNSTSKKRGRYIRSKSINTEAQTVLNESYIELNVDKPIFSEHSDKNSTSSERMKVSHSPAQINNDCKIDALVGASVLNTTELHKRHRIQIFSDVPSRMRNMLQNHVGSSYFVSSICKSGASSDRLLESCLEICKDFKKTDYVVIMCGTNDKDPLRLQSVLYFYLDKLAHTNVLLCNIHISRLLSEWKLHECFVHICSQFSHTVFVDVNINKKAPYDTYILVMCRLILRDILHLSYKYNYNVYIKSQGNNNVLSISTQTDSSSLHTNTCSRETQTEEYFFRD